ncbi:TetR/AcrR family transcriptional regulator [Streptomyces celluloflavus]|uniref:TetR/AcrR family transcriptional regulator n=1 Tax=Streptomyces celluloflavus TaxID=58344 RepID=UPI00368CF47B
MALVLWGDRTRHTVRGEDLGGTGSRRAVRAARGGKSGHGEAAHTAAQHTDRIIREALALIDAEGADAFSLPRLAARLGIRTPSLYHHVTGRAAVVEGVRRLVVEEMDTSAFADRPWDAALTAWARSYRDAFARHRTARHHHDQLTGHPRQVRDGPGRARPQRLVAVLTSVEAFLLGSALDLAAPPLMIDPSAGGAAVPLPAAALDGAPRKAARAEEAFAAAWTRWPAAWWPNSPRHARESPGRARGGGPAVLARARPTRRRSGEDCAAPGC